MPKMNKSLHNAAIKQYIVHNICWSILNLQSTLLYLFHSREQG